MNQIYWRWKGDKHWFLSRCNYIGNGLIRLFDNEFDQNDNIIVSLDEIETKDLPQ